MDQIKSLTVPEVRDLAQKDGLSGAGKKQQLLTRLIWVRDQDASGFPETNDKSSSTGLDEAEQVKDSLDTTSGNLVDSDDKTEELELFGDDEDDIDEADEQGEVGDISNILSRRKSGTLAAGRSEDDELTVIESDDEMEESCDSKQRECQEDTTCPLRATLRSVFGHRDFRDGQE